MTDVVFVKDYATYKEKDKISLKSNLASLVLRLGVAKLVKTSKRNKTK